MNNKTVVVGMSGGVDSSIAAYILKEQGYKVIGATMQLWKDKNTSVIDDARRVAKQLDIPYYVVDFKEEFYNKVINYFIDEYRNGNTPNPCIICNKYIKWGAFLNYYLENGADYIATGHYAHIIKLDNGRYTVKKSSAARKKDQSYVLYSLSQYQLSHTLMPLGKYSKEEVKTMAKKLNLNVANKSESQDICFVPDHDYVRFIETQTGKKCVSGNFIDDCGNVLGVHKGIENYTIGQRRGLEISAEKPYYVKEIIPNTNEVVLGNADSLFTDTVYVDNINYMASECLKEPRRLTAKIRYSHIGAECEVMPFKDGYLKCKFYEKQRAITSGQAIVFYEDDNIFGGGRIIIKHHQQ